MVSDGQLEECQGRIQKLEDEVEDKQQSVRIVERKSQNLVRSAC